jgi:hypothetical protein
MRRFSTFDDVLQLCCLLLFSEPLASYIFCVYRVSGLNSHLGTTVRLGLQRGTNTKYAFHAMVLSASPFSTFPATHNIWFVPFIVFVSLCF